MVSICLVRLPRLKKMLPRPKLVSVSTQHHKIWFVAIDNGNALRCLKQ